jgi:predicted dehydrogenase
VIGHGFMGRAHSFAWIRAGHVANGVLSPRLVVLCGRDSEALARHAEQYGFLSWSDSWLDVVHRDDIDVVDICTPGKSHTEIALAALGAGKHVFCEKPLANTVAEARELAAASDEAAARGVFSMVGYNYRRVPAVAMACRFVQEGRLGAIRHVRASYLQDWLVDPAFPLTWRLDKDEAGSGALGDLLAHVIDLVRYLTGAEIEKVVSVLTTFVTERPLAASQTGLRATVSEVRRAGRVTVDDAVLVLARLHGGAVATMEASRVAPGRKNAMVVELNGSCGSLRFDLERFNELEIYEVGASDDGFVKVLVTNPDDPYIAQWWPPGHIIGWEHTFVHEFEDYMAAIAASRQPTPSFSEGLVTQQVLDAIDRSARNGTWTVVS